MADLVTVRFDYTGSTQTWRVPGHVPGTLKFRLVGGTGGDFFSGSALGGAAGYITGLLDVARGTTLTIGLGGAGEDAVNEPAGVITVAAGGGGPRPGGDGGISGSHALAPPDPGLTYESGGGGGGGSELKIGSTVVAVAGGGGGAPRNFTSGGGNAGAAQTGNGAGALGTADTNVGGSGQGGTTSAAGSGGYSATSKFPTYLEAGGDGSAGAGGDGASFIYVPGSPLFESRCGGGGGGGGGYYGGGGGGGSKIDNAAGSGGGGSSWSNATYVTEGTGLSADPPVDGDGYITFEYEPVGGIYVDGAVHF